MGKKKIFGYGDFYCWNCGSRIIKDNQHCPDCGSLYLGDGKYGNLPAQGAGGIGWSDQVGHPSLKKYHKSKTRAVMVWLIGISILIPGALLLTRQISLDAEGKYVIKGLLAIFWTIGLLFAFVGNRNKPDWDGVVEDKRIEKKVRKVKDDEGFSQKQPYTDYIVVIRKQDGRSHELSWESDSSKFNYYRIGDYLHYHGNKYIDGFEKYDKTLDSFLQCLACGDRRNPRDNFCGRCGTVLLKGELEK